MAEPNDLQRMAINSLKNGIPSGTRMKTFAYAPRFEGAEESDVIVARTTTRDGVENTENFVVGLDGKVAAG